MIAETTEPRQINVSSDIRSEVLTIGGDINQHIHSGKDWLAPVHLSNNESCYLSPNFTSELISRVLEKHIVLISESSSIVNTDLVRHIAAELNRETDMPVCELVRETDENSDSIVQIIEKNDPQGKIVLLYDLHPQAIAYKFNDLLQLMLKADCMFIITACCGPEIWNKAGKVVTDYWFEIPKGRHYSDVQLHDFFVDELRKKTPMFLESSIMEDDFLLSPSMRVSDAIAALETLEQVQLLISCYSFNELPTDHRLTELLNKLRSGSEQMIKAWFYQLSHRNRILALSAALFDGLLVDQYLEALGSIADSNAWDIREPSLKTIDYFDLSAIDAFFQVQVRGAECFLEAKSPLSRHTLIDLGKTEYRRHFKTCLSAFLSITKKTYDRKPVNYELYGSIIKRMTIRYSYIETLRSAGAIDFRLVENHLLELAASGDFFLQNICAKAIAKWRTSRNEELFFSTLRTWRGDQDITDRMNLWFRRNENAANINHEEAADLIKSTAVLVLGHASAIDPPNNLHEEIAESMIKYAMECEDKKHLFANISKALPQFIHHHSLQLENRLYSDLMTLSQLNKPLTEGLFQALETYPSEVSSMLKNWLDICLQDTSKDNRRGQPTFRDNRLLILLDILCQVDISANPVFTQESIYTDYLIPLIAYEGRDAVIKMTLKLLARIQSEDYDLALKYAGRTIEKLSKSRKLELAEYWAKIYRKERLDMDGSEKFTYNDQSFAIWTINNSRPLTGTESTLYKWMEGNDTVRRFATLVFLEITRSHDSYERLALQQREIERIQPANRWTAQPAGIVRTVFVRPEINLRLGLRIRIFFYFIFSSNKNKFILKDTILLFLNINRYSSVDLQQLIQRWLRDGRQGVTGKLARWLPTILRFKVIKR